MADQKRESPSFLQVIADARNIPEGVDPMAERDAPRAMDQGNGEGLVSPPEFGAFDQIGSKIRCLQFSEVFVLWRPWETCSVCRGRINDDPSLMPEDDTYTCPHVQNKKYKETIDMCLSGKGMLATKEFFNLKNGTRVAHVEWLEGDPAHLAQLQKEAEIAKERAVYPPNPEEVFSKGKKKK
jgi:hypothetical protein